MLHGAGDRGTVAHIAILGDAPLEKGIQPDFADCWSDGATFLLSLPCVQVCGHWLIRVAQLRTIDAALARWGVGALPRLCQDQRHGFRAKPTKRITGSPAG